MIPAADVHIDLDLVRRLLESQAPHLASLPLRVAAEGWDNVMVRAGEELVVRLPRRKIAAEMFSNEVTWAPLLAPGLPLPIPVPRFVGSPGGGYPYTWAVSNWPRMRRSWHASWPPSIGPPPQWFPCPTAWARPTLSRHLRRRDRQRVTCRQLCR
jgi:aminoglycoside phosphotransferase (APT) family kinase protein